MGDSFLVISFSPWVGLVAFWMNIYCMAPAKQSVRCLMAHLKSPGPSVFMDTREGTMDPTAPVPMEIWCCDFSSNVTLGISRCATQLISWFFIWPSDVFLNVFEKCVALSLFPMLIRHDSLTVSLPPPYFSSLLAPGCPREAVAVLLMVTSATLGISWLVATQLTVVQV